MLMPSFCWPFGIGPWPAMMRPLTGQRDLGSEPVPSAVLVASLPGCPSATGANTLALGAVSVSVAGVVSGAALACATAAALLGVKLGLAADVRTPGMVSRSPTLSLAVIGRLFALAISPTGLP